jgi:hypothetical protein
MAPFFYTDGCKKKICFPDRWLKFWMKQDTHFFVTDGCKKKISFSDQCLKFWMKQVVNFFF